MQQKLKVARKMAQVGRYPATYDALLMHLPHVLLERLTAREVSMTMDALWECSKASKAIAERDAINEGAIWDEKAQGFRTIGPVAYREKQVRT